MIHTLSLSGAHTVGQAEDTAVLFTAALGQASPLTLNCEAIEEADLTFIQLVLALKKSVEQSGGTLTLSKPAKGALLAALDTAGISPDGVHRFWFEGTSS